MIHSEHPAGKLVQTKIFVHIEPIIATQRSQTRNPVESNLAAAAKQSVAECPVFANRVIFEL